VERTSVAVLDHQPKIVFCFDKLLFEEEVLVVFDTLERHQLINQFRFDLFDVLVCGWELLDAKVESFGR